MQTKDSRCNNIISITKTLQQTITTGYMKSKLKAENVTVIETCLTTARQRDTTKKKKTPIKKSQILSNIISKNIYNNLHHFDNDIIVQVDNGNTKTKQIQLTRNVRRSQIIQTKSEEISSPSKLFHGAPLFSCVSKRFCSNLISKSTTYLIFTAYLIFTTHLTFTAYLIFTTYLIFTAIFLHIISRFNF